MHYGASRADQQGKQMSLSINKSKQFHIGSLESSDISLRVFSRRQCACVVQSHDSVIPAQVASAIIAHLFLLVIYA